MKQAALKSVLIVTAILLSMTVSARAELADAEKSRVGLEAILWFPTVSGNAQFDTEYIDGDNLDFIDLLGIDETATDFGLGVWLNITKRNRLSLYWFMDSRSGSGKLEERITVAGSEFLVGAKIDSEIDIQNAKLIFEHSFFRNDRFRLALGAGLSYFDVSAKLDGTLVLGPLSNDDGIDKNVQAGVPVLAAAAEVHLPLGFGVFAEGCGMGLQYDYAYARYFDVRGGVNWKSRFVFAQGGYQYMTVGVNAFDKLRMDYTLAGFFVSAGAKF